MNPYTVPLVVLSLVAGESPPAPKMPIGKDTTYVTGPLDKQGYIDYEAALNERLGKGITPAKNANVLLWKAFGPTPEGSQRMPAAFFKGLGIEEPPPGGTYFIDLYPFLKDHRKLDPAQLDAVSDQEYRASQRPWAAKDYPHIAGWLKANEWPLALVVEATRRPEYFNPLVRWRKDNEPASPHSFALLGVQMCRRLASALAARAMLRVGEGKFDEAWQDLLACHRLGRLVARGGTGIEGMVGIAIDGIAADADLAYLERARLSAAQIQDRIKDLQSLPAMPATADKVDLGERFMALDTFQFIRRGGSVDVRAKKPSPQELKDLEKIDWEPALRDCNRWHDRLAAALRLKDRGERRKAFEEIGQDLHQIEENLKKGRTALGKLSWLLMEPSKAAKEAGQRIGDNCIGLAMPMYGKLRNSFDRAEQVQRNLYIAFALAAYHRDHGRYPGQLNKLAPRYLPAVPVDVFSGWPPIYHPKEYGYLLYSVGANGQDEGGRSIDDDPPGDDLRVRMPLPELKGEG